MNKYRWLFIVLLLSAPFFTMAQKDTMLRSVTKTDSALEQLKTIPVKYIKQVDVKMDKYTKRITNKTEQTLQRLAKWESKIRSILEKTNPVAAQKLFANNQLTFAAALEKYKKGEAIVEGQRAKYNEYRDKLTTSLGYLAQQKDSLKAKLVTPVKKAQQKITALETQEGNTEAMQQFIKERRKQLINEATKYLANTKYLQKISSETGLYIATLQNYKELFQDKKKAEETALTILNKIPAFTKFVQENSYLAKLFGSPNSSGTGSASLAGLQTRSSVNNLIQNQLAAAGPNAAAQIRQNMQDAQAQLNTLKDKVLKAGGSASGNDAIAQEYGKFPQQKTKTFIQRIKLGTDVGFIKDNSLMPTVANLALNATYSLATNKEAGIGVAYKAGLGSINHISITHQGFGLRSFASLRLKKNFWMAGGWEANQNAGFKNIAALKDYNQWTQSALIGIEKKIPVKTKFTKGTKLQLLYDMLYREHTPVSQPVVFRVGYNF